MLVVIVSVAAAPGPKPGTLLSLADTHRVGSNFDVRPLDPSMPGKRWGRSTVTDASCFVANDSCLLSEKPGTASALLVTFDCEKPNSNAPTRNWFPAFSVVVPGVSNSFLACPNGLKSAPTSFW